MGGMPVPEPGLRLDVPRAEALAHATTLIAGAGLESFDARGRSSAVDEALRAVLAGPISLEPTPARALDDAARVLDVSIAQPRPRFLAYVGSTGLEIGVLGDALMPPATTSTSPSPPGGADLLERAGRARGSASSSASVGDRRRVIAAAARSPT